MSKLFSAITALCLVGALAGGVDAKAKAKTSPAPSMAPMSSMSSMTSPHPCPSGKKWVNGYTTKSGKKVSGYCR
jgi:hypothetical protein